MALSRKQTTLVGAAPERTLPAARATWRPRRPSLAQVLVHGGLIIWAVLSLYPVVWVILTSLKYQAELYQNPFALPATLVWSNFRAAWLDANMSRYFVNSGVVTLVSTVALLFLASMCAFALSRFTFRFKGVVWAYTLFGFLIPATLMLLPLGQLTRTLGLYNNIFGLALVYAAAGIPFNTFFLRAYMETIPHELEEAAIIDGAGMWMVYWRVILPLARPALTTMATFSMLYSWSEFIFALILTGGSDAARTLPVGISLIATTYSSNEPTVAAAMVISLIPAVVLFAFLQRYVVQGLTAGALK